MCSLPSRRRTLLTRCLTEIRKGSYRIVKKEVIANHKTSLWFMCYKSVQRINVAQPSERSNKTKWQTSIHELLSRYLANVAVLKMNLWDLIAKIQVVSTARQRIFVSGYKGFDGRYWVHIQGRWKNVCNCLQIKNAPHSKANKFLSI
jgi:hypothetical protein